MSYRSIVLAVLVAGALIAGCQSADDGPDDSTALSRVRIIATEMLSPPAIGTLRAFTPDQTFQLPGSNGIEAVGFFVTASTTDPAKLRFRITNVNTNASTMFTRVSPSATSSIQGAIDSLNTEALAMLSNGHGLYWQDGSATGDADIENRFGLLIPAFALGAPTSISAFVSTTTGGAPRGGDQIELVREFFYLTALGDSVMWGNGLREEDKFSALVAAQIEEELGVRVIRTVHAVSGATIAPNDLDGLCTRNCSGEAPQFFTSIGLQAGAMEHPDLIDLILMDGCANDIGLETVLSSTDNTEEITTLANEFCFGEMANLLIRVRALAPDAPIVVNGYFPFVSMNSDLSEVGTWTEANDIDIGSIEDLTPGLTAFLDNSRVFQESTAAGLTSAVELVNSLEFDDPPIVFVDAGYGETNATFASETWLWGLTNNFALTEQLDITLDLFPEDPIFYARVDLCLNVEVAPAFLGCIYGSVGHPNTTGARQYATGIIDSLREVGVLLAETAAP